MFGLSGVVLELRATDPEAGHREAGALEERGMKNSKYIFKAIPKPGILDANDYSDDVPPAELTGYDGTYVYGWYVDGFIVGKVMDYHDEYIDLEYWVPVDPETVCLVHETSNGLPHGVR